MTDFWIIAGAFVALMVLTYWLFRDSAPPQFRCQVMTCERKGRVLSHGVWLCGEHEAAWRREGE